VLCKLGKAIGIRGHLLYQVSNVVNDQLLRAAITEIHERLRAALSLSLG
jgi:hypothetical protein